MRPLLGIVVDRETVQCENGLTLTTHIPPTINTHEKVYVCFSLYTGRVSRVISTKEGENKTIQKPVQIEDTPNCTDELFCDATDTNDGSETIEDLFLELSEPYSEEYGFWDSGVLELSEPYSEGETPQAAQFGQSSHHLGRSAQKGK